MIKLLVEHFGPDVFNTKSTGNGVGDCISDEKVGKVTLRDYYTYEKGKAGIIKYMTADEYIDNCIHKIFHSTYDRTITNAVDMEKVSEYADKMRRGVLFPMPYLDYTTNQQEGRHRALAYKQAFGSDAEFPVLEIYPTDVTDDEIYNYCTRKWGNGDMWFEYVAYGLGRTKKEVCDYLGKPYKEEPNEYEPDDLDNIDDLIANDIDIDDDYDDTIKELSQKCGKSVEEIEKLDAYSLTMLLKRYL